MNGKILSGWKKEAERRRVRRHELDLSLEVVANLMGVSPSTLHRYERGARRPSRQTESDWTAALRKEAP